MAKTSFAFPKPQYWQEFEDLTHEVFKCAFGDDTPTKHGRSGQNQYGVDVFGRKGGGNGDLIGIQCKRREGAESHRDAIFGYPLKLRDVKEEVAKVNLEKLALKQFIVATTAPADAEIQDQVERYNEERWSADREAFRVAVWHWQDYEAYLNGNVGLQNWYFKDIVDLFGRERAELHILILLRDALSRPAFRDPLYQENAANFRQAIGHTQQAVDLGILVDRITGLTIRKAIGGVKSLSSSSSKRIGPLLIKAITKLAQRYDWAMKESMPHSKGLTRLEVRAGILLVHDRTIGDELNGYRREAIRLVNELLDEAKMDKIETPDI